MLLAWAELLFPQIRNYSFLRAMRALRPLRAVNRLPGMKRQVNTLLEALPYMLDALLLFAFTMVIFGVLGVQLFKGTLIHRCYEPGAAEPVDPDRGVCAAGGEGRHEGC